ncbi:MAG TPA: hypothetical protein DEQ40_21215 [Oxalobacteraceae bacterium]|nr:hypothetical protein [Oxalobacteraceae bacterium]
MHGQLIDKTLSNVPVWRAGRVWTDTEAIRVSCAVAIWFIVAVADENHASEQFSQPYSFTDQLPWTRQ